MIVYDTINKNCYTGTYFIFCLVWIYCKFYFYPYHIKNISIYVEYKYVLISETIHDLDYDDVVNNYDRFIRSC